MRQVFAVFKASAYNFESERDPCPYADVFGQHMYDSRLIGAFEARGHWLKITASWFELQAIYIFRIDFEILVPRAVEKLEVRIFCIICSFLSSQCGERFGDCQGVIHGPCSDRHSIGKQTTCTFRRCFSDALNDSKRMTSD